MQCNHRPSRYLLDTEEEEGEAPIPISIPFPASGRERGRARDSCTCGKEGRGKEKHLLPPKAWKSERAGVETLHAPKQPTKRTHRPIHVYRPTCRLIHPYCPLLFLSLPHFPLSLHQSHPLFKATCSEISFIHRGGGRAEKCHFRYPREVLLPKQSHSSWDIWKVRKYTHSHSPLCLFCFHFLPPPLLTCLPLRFWLRWSSEAYPSNRCRKIGEDQNVATIPLFFLNTARFPPPPSSSADVAWSICPE